MIHDFAGPYYISIDDFAFGETHKYVKLDLEGVSPEKFDQAIVAADEIYKKRTHNIFCDNCHSHVAQVLNILEYKGKSNYTMVHVWWMCIVSSRYVHCCHVFKTYALWMMIAIFVGIIFLLQAI